VLRYLPRLLLPESFACFNNPGGSGYSVHEAEGRRAASAREVLMRARARPTRSWRRPRSARDPGDPRPGSVARPAARRGTAASAVSWDFAATPILAPGAGERTAAVPPSVRDIVHEPGQPLAASAQALFGPRFAGDVSGIRVHAGAEAARAAAAIDAAAFTVGRHIVFGADRYAPASAVGARLIAHELAHTVQQRHAGAPVDRFAANRAAEREAEAAAGAAMAGRPPAVTASAAGVQCQPAEGEATPQPERPAPGSGYPTAWQAAFAALARYNPQSILSKDPNDRADTGKEYGGLIYKLGGEFFYTEAVISPEAKAIVDPWDALDKVPPEARRSIVGDYHTHGAPPPPTPEFESGEDFSGLHAAVSPLIGASSGQAQSSGDLFAGRLALVTHSANILDVSTYTLFLGTPRGRFALFTPGKNILFSFSPDPRLLPAAKPAVAVPAAAAQAKPSEPELEASPVAAGPVMLDPVHIRFVYDRPRADESAAALGAVTTSQGRKALDALAASLKADAKLRVTLLGRASPPGKPGYNFELAARRARLVAEALKVAGVSAAQIADAPAADLPEGCKTLEPGVMSCGEIGGRGVADQEVKALVFKSG
jgi:hypothetical protein